MDPSIHDKLSCVDEEFIHAAVGGFSALTVFQNNWSTLLFDSDLAIQSKSVRDETTTLRNIVSSRISLLSDYLLEFYASADSIETGLEAVFAQIDLNDKLGSQISDSMQEGGNKCIGSEYRANKSFSSSATPSYIEPAYRWLLKNLHNPYPSKAVKERISNETGSHRRVIDAWFVEVRQRIGWNYLRKTQFANKRVEIVDAATGFFTQQGSKQPLDPNIELELAAIETRANDLYSEKFTGSTLAAKLDVAVKDMTHEIKAHAKADQKRCQQRIKEVEQASSSRRSPDRSSYTSTCLPSPSDGVNLGSTASHKQCSPPPGSHYNSKVSPGLANCSRLDIPSSTNVITGFPSPTPSHDSPQLLDQGISMYISAAPADDLPPISRTSRKRCLSDVNNESSKRPRHIFSSPQHYTMSDSSLPSSLSQHNFAIPNAVTEDGLDLSLPLEVELYNYSGIDFRGSSTCLSDTHIQPYTPPLSIAQTIIDAVEIEPNALDIFTNDFDYTELFREPEDNINESYEQDLMNKVDNSPRLTFQSSAFEHDFISNSLDPFATTFHPISSIDLAVIADPSKLVSQDPASSFDWIFPPLSPPQDAFNFHQALESSNLSQDNGLVFEPVDCRRMSSSCNDLSHMPFNADKAVKQIRLMEMREATRRLEAEIAAS